MAQANFTMLRENDALNAATVNGMFTPVVTQSAQVGSTNVRPEGLDRDAFAPSTASVYRSTFQTSSTPISYGITGGGANYECDAADGIPIELDLVPGVSRMRLDNGGAGYSLSANTIALRLRWSFGVRSISGDSWDPCVVQIQLWRQVNGAAPTAIPEAFSHLGYCTRGVFTPTTGELGTSFTRSHLYYFTASQQIDWFEVRIRWILGGGAAANQYLYISDGSFNLTAWKR